MSGRPFPLEMTKPKGPFGGRTSSSRRVPSEKTCVTLPTGRTSLEASTSSTLRALWRSSWGLSGLQQQESAPRPTREPTGSQIKLFLHWIFPVTPTWVPSRKVSAPLPVWWSALSFSLNSAQRRPCAVVPVAAPGGKKGHYQNVHQSCMELAVPAASYGNFLTL